MKCPCLRNTNFGLVKCRRRPIPGIVTTNSGKNVARFLQNHGLNAFDFTYADARLLGKSRLLGKVIRKERLSKADTLYIGDEIRDITAARKAGIGVIAVSWGYNTSQSLAEARPDVLVDDLDGLKQAVARFLTGD